MANPPDNNNPSNNNPQSPKPGVDTPKVNTQSPAQPGNQGTGGKPGLSAGESPQQSKPAVKPATQSPVPAKPATPPPVPGTTKGTTTGTTTGTATETNTPGRRAADSAASQTGQTQPQKSRSKLERPLPAGSAEPTTRKTSPQTRPVKSLTRPTPEPSARPPAEPPARSPERVPEKAPARSPERAAERPAGNYQTAAEKPAAARSPQARPDRQARPNKQEGHRSQRVRHDNAPRRQMAPPPGAKGGRFAAPAGQPARSGQIAPSGRSYRDSYRDRYRGEDRSMRAYHDNRPRRRMAPPPGAKNGRYVAPAAQPVRREYVVPPAVAAPGGSAWGPLLLGLLLLLGVLWYAIKFYTPQINADLAARTNSALGSAGYDAASVEIDGRTATLTGSVATDADSKSAEELVLNTDGVRSVDNQLVVGESAASATAERIQPALAFQASEGGVELSGTVSDQAYADEIENSAKEIYGNDQVSGSITVDPNSTNPGWWPAVQQLTPDLKNMNGSFSVEDGTLTLNGTAPDAQSKADIGAKAEQLVAGQLTVDNRITAPEAAAEPEPAPEPLKPAFLNYFNDGESIQLSGYLPTESATAITNAFADAELPVKNNIDISDAYAAPDWATDFAAATSAMQDIETAEVEVQTDGSVTIYGVATSEEAKQAAEDNIASIYSGQSLDNQISVQVPEPEKVVPSFKPFAFLSDDGTTVTVTGLLPPDATQTISGALENTGRTVVNEVTIDERVIEPEWTDALTASLQAMNAVENPEIIITTSGTLTLRGLADNESIRQQAGDASLNRFGNSVSLRNDIAVKGPDITELLARIDLAAIRFRSGSAQLDAESVGILEQVADALTQVPDANVAISGHTDSTGSAERNLVLSGQRADRVREFLLERGISGDRMTSQGFGSSQPIASNGTVTGRALNRRIDIALTNGE